MDLSLNLWAVTNLSSLPSIILRVVEVLIGINALIIVHEFGHFIAARLCGVRCEKFFIWFDAWGYKFFSFKVGNTEYGLGWLPLGGYVKMLGQEDNPGQIKEELARAKEGAQEGDGTDSEAAQKRVEELSKAIYAKDSFQSKNVFQRMVIISAGVIMNVIFAILCAAAAYLLRTGGSFCLVHRPERLSELFVCLSAHGLEPKRLRLVCPREGSAPSLVLVEARRGGKPGLVIEPALLLTDADGKESEEVRRIYHR